MSAELAKDIENRLQKWANDHHGATITQDAFRYIIKDAVDSLYAWNNQALLYGLDPMISQNNVHDREKWTYNVTFTPPEGETGG